MMRASIMTEGLGGDAVWVSAKSGSGVVEGVFLDGAYADLLYLAAMLDGREAGVLDVEAVSVEYLSDDLGRMTTTMHVAEPLTWDTVAKLFAALPDCNIAVCAVDVRRAVRHVQ